MRCSIWLLPVAELYRHGIVAFAIRNGLLANGILLEDSNDGVRWKRKLK
jgi:hypothetical protein